jgi:hypothetical protein
MTKMGMPWENVLVIHWLFDALIDCRFSNSIRVIVFKDFKHDGSDIQHVEASMALCIKKHLTICELGPEASPINGRFYPFGI